MKFLVEDSLTKLAKKLRFLGFDTEICSRNEIEGAVSNRDVFLTKSRKALEIAMRFRIRCYLIKSENWKSQLKSVVHRFRISHKDIDVLSRCSKCNGELEIASLEDLCGVPDYILLTKENFSKCKNCGHIYWKGSHVEHMRMIIEIVEKW
jgi:hypothetical protein